MITGRPRRLLKSRLFQISVSVLAIWTCFETFFVHRTLLAANNVPIRRTNSEKIFIASLPWNNEIIFRTHLIKQIQDLIQVLGAENVYISIYENGSYDGTKNALRELFNSLEELGVRNRVVLDDTSHADIVHGRPREPKEGWIRVNESGFESFAINKGDYALRRIYYLAQLRNRVLEPLHDLAERGEKFDKVLFLNDVAFTTDDVLNLLQTRDGNYAAACTLDFQLPPAFYDTFALRDSDGYPALMPTWPFFRSSASRQAVIANEPIPVQSCWNGLVSMSAAPFYSKINPLHFRGVPDSLAYHHVEGSECCLIHTDNALSAHEGVWINPNVRVGYCHPDLSKPGKVALDWDVFKHVCQMAYDTVHPASGAWVSSWQIASGLWESRLRRWLSVGWTQNWKARRKLRAWEAASERNVEVGEMCLIDEMHVIEPHGWLHV